MFFFCWSQWHHQHPEEVRSKAPSMATESLTVDWRFFSQMFASEYLLGRYIFKAKSVCSHPYSKKESERHKQFSYDVSEQCCMPRSCTCCKSDRQTTAPQAAILRVSVLSCTPPVYLQPETPHSVRMPLGSQHTSTEKCFVGKRQFLSHSVDISL